MELAARRQWNLREIDFGVAVEVSRQAISKIGQKRAILTRVLQL
jgi:hypothetical protein